jgi:hypothetical protein
MVPFLLKLGNGMFLYGIYKLILSIYPQLLGKSDFNFFKRDSFRIIINITKLICTRKTDVFTLAQCFCRAWHVLHLSCSDAILL